MPSAAGVFEYFPLHVLTHFVCRMQELPPAFIVVSEEAHRGGFWTGQELSGTHTQWGGTNMPLTDCPGTSTHFPAVTAEPCS
jgi:hypothetical protein